MLRWVCSGWVNCKGESSVLPPREVPKPTQRLDMDILTPVQTKFAEWLVGFCTHQHAMDCAN